MRALTALASAPALAIPTIANASAESEKPATAEQWAEANFEPLTIDEMPTYEEWQAMAEGHAVTLRIARVTLSKTKEEVKEDVRKIHARPLRAPEFGRENVRAFQVGRRMRIGAAHRRRERGA